VAAGILALRANDGRSIALAPFVPAPRPGSSAVSTRWDGPTRSSSRSH
jgi:hypothetical protein